MVGRRRRVDYQIVSGYLLLVAGVLLTTWLCWVLLNGWLTYRWQETEAVIYRSGIVYSTSTPGDKSNSLYSVKITYRYRVNGIAYSNSQVNQTDFPLMNSDQAEALVKRFKIGSVQTVYYDDREPSDSALVKGISYSLMLLFAPAILFLVIGLRARRQSR